MPARRLGIPRSPCMIRFLFLLLPVFLITQFAMTGSALGKASSIEIIAPRELLNDEIPYLQQLVESLLQKIRPCGRKRKSCFPWCPGTE